MALIQEMREPETRIELAEAFYLFVQDQWDLCVNFIECDENHIEMTVTGGDLRNPGVNATFVIMDTRDYSVLRSPPAVGESRLWDKEPELMWLSRDEARMIQCMRQAVIWPQEAIASLLQGKDYNASKLDAALARHPAPANEKPATSNGARGRKAKAKNS